MDEYIPISERNIGGIDDATEFTLYIISKAFNSGLMCSSVIVSPAISNILSAHRSFKLNTLGDSSDFVGTLEHGGRHINVYRDAYAMDDYIIMIDSTVNTSHSKPFVVQLHKDTWDIDFVKDWQLYFSWMKI
jgi:hypothetical protein